MSVYLRVCVCKMQIHTSQLADLVYGIVKDYKRHGET